MNNDEKYKRGKLDGLELARQNIIQIGESVGLDTEYWNGYRRACMNLVTTLTAQKEAVRMGKEIGIETK